MSTSQTKRDERRWRMLVARATKVETFFYGVRTTGIFCRPGCASRLPRRENVRFFEEAAAARAAGFRPCKRCRPEETEPDAKAILAIERVCRLLTARQPAPNLGELAAAVDYSPGHLQRVFKQVVGVSPKAFALALRQQGAKENLQKGEKVLRAAINGGYGNVSGLYREAKRTMGMTPAKFRQGGEAAALRVATAKTSLGCLLVAATEQGICEISLGDDEAELLAQLQARFPRATLFSSNRQLAKWVREVVSSIDKPPRSFRLPLDVQGTALQRRVWEALQRVPPGKTISYTQLAAAIGQPRAVRAVANACAANRLAIVIPCHRAVRQTGALSGYRWGIERKRALLQREQQIKK